METVRRVTAAELRQAMDFLHPLFDGVCMRELSEEGLLTGTGGWGRSRPFLLETASGEQKVLLELTDRSVHSWIEQMSEALYRDELTQVYNRRYLNELRFLRPGQVPCPLGLILLDLRRFKQINDTLGHMAGDRFLRRTAATLEACGEDWGTVVRFGGDEFVVLVPDCGEDMVRQRVETLRAAVEQVTEADFGCAWTGDFQADRHLLLTLLDAADRRMYEEKRRHGTCT